MNYKKFEFIKSVTDSNKIEKTMPQIALCGRSNVGKSSFINMLAGNSKLAKTSSTPGRTRLINLFNADDKFVLVDLPGYGFARATTNEQNEWAKMINAYIESDKMDACILLLDIRHKPSEKDKQMLDFISSFSIPVVICATKLDKIKKSEIRHCAQVIATELKIGIDDIILTSAETKQGKDKALQKIEQVLRIEER